MNEQEHSFVEQFKEQQRINFKINMEHGFEPDHDADYNVAEKIALMHPELFEALEYLRKDNGPSGSHSGVQWRRRGVCGLHHPNHEHSTALAFAGEGSRGDDCQASIQRRADLLNMG